MREEADDPNDVEFELDYHYTNATVIIPGEVIEDMKELNGVEFPIHPVMNAWNLDLTTVTQLFLKISTAQIINKNRVKKRHIDIKNQCGVLVWVNTIPP